MRQFRRTLLGAGAALIVSSCLSPTLPLPPPDRPDVEQIGQGEYRVTGAIPERGMATVMNSRTRLQWGQFTEARYSFIVHGEPGDAMLFWYVVSGQSSEYLFFDLGENTEGGPTGKGDAGTASDGAANAADAADAAD